MLHFLFASLEKLKYSPAQVVTTLENKMKCGVGICGRCNVGPVSFPVYQTPQKVKMGAMIASDDVNEIEREVTEVYRCVGCEACLDRCPHDIDMPKVMRAIRRMLVEYDSYPTELRDSVSRIQSDGNPFGEAQEGRTAVTENAGRFAPFNEMGTVLRC